MMRCPEALDRFMRMMKPKGSILEVGSGKGLHTRRFRNEGFTVKTIDPNNPADHVGMYPVRFSVSPFDGIWCCHVLEHCLDTNTILESMHRDLCEEGILCICIPPPRDDLRGGHIHEWNEGLLIYNLILAKFDCSEARVFRDALNICVLLKKKTIQELPRLVSGPGDLEKLSQYFPVPVRQKTDGRFGLLNW